MADAPPPYYDGEKYPSYPPPGQQSAYPPPGQQSAYPPTSGYGAPPPQGYPQQYQPAPGQQAMYVTGTTVVVAQPTKFGPHQANATCTKCNALVTTEVNYESGLMAWLLCLAIAFFGGWLGCCLIPFCVDGCKDAVHKCPNCQNVMGVYKRIS